MACAMLVADDLFCHASPAENGWLLFGLLIYPHIGQLLFGRFDIRRLRGRTLLLIDGLFAGAVIAGLDMASFPSAVISAINLFNWMVVGGTSLVFAGLLTMIAGFVGMAIGDDIGSFNLARAACTAPDWLASLFLIVYLLVTTNVIRRLVQDLGQHQLKLQAETDAACEAKTIATSTLFSSLPPWVARQLIDKQTITPDDISDATLLLLRLDSASSRALSLERLAEYLQVSQPIMTRHGFEMIKSFGSTILAVTRAASGPDDGVSALQEISTYFIDHADADTPALTGSAIRAVLTSGPARLGLVDAERLNLELTGKAMESLNTLAVILEETGPAVQLVIDSATRQRLQDVDKFAFIAGDGKRPPHFRLLHGSQAS
jgi:class 3 adenylate cyclase